MTLRKKITTLFTACVMCALGVGLAAATETGKTTVATNDVNSNATVPHSANPVLNSPAVLIHIETIPNTVDSAAAKKIAEHNNNDKNNPWNYCMVSTVDAQLYEFPAQMLQPESVRDMVVIFKEGNRSVDKGRDFLATEDGYYYVQEELKHKYAANRDGEACSSYNPDVVYSSIVGDQIAFGKFKKGELTVDGLAPHVNQVGLDSSVKQFIYLWNNAETVSVELNKMFKEKGTDAYYKNMLHYLDFLYTIYDMTGNDQAAAEKINIFLKNLNQDGTGTSDFVIVNFAAASGGPMWSDAFPNCWPIYTLPTWYSFSTNATTEQYRKVTAFGLEGTAAIDQKKDSAHAYASVKPNWEKDVYKRYESVGKKKTGSYAARMIDGVNHHIQWWSKNSAPCSAGNKNTAFMCLPTDMYGDAVGGVGYTYFTTGFVGGLPDTGTITGKFSITASTDQHEVQAKGTKVSADMWINLKQDADIYSKIEQIFIKLATKNQDKAKLQITTSITKLKGNADSAAVVDAVQDPTGTTITGGKTVVWDNVKWTDIRNYLNGKQKMHLIDSLIDIKEDSTNRYNAQIVMTFPNGDKVNFAATGKIVVSKWVGADDVDWTIVAEKENVAHYNSIPKQSYAEIKEGSPGNEKWEAMAGVPTTENLYNGFGATEFITNMDCEEKTSPESERVYTTTYVCDRCAEKDTVCEYSCPGHTNDDYSGGCGAVIDVDDEGNEITCDSGSSQTVYCSNGVVTAVSECGCGAESSTKTWTPVWGSGYQECLAQDDNSPRYSGMGCVVTHHTNRCHTHVHTYTGTVNQPIKPFEYLDITAMNLWQLTEARLEGNPKLFVNPNQTIDPNTGYMTYYNQEEYKNNNGRLRFSFVLGSDKNKWGNTNETQHDNKVMLETVCDDTATKWMNSKVLNKTTNAKVISDYEVLATTEGLQAVAYHTYDSDTVNVTSTAFTAGGSNSGGSGYDNDPDKKNKVVTGDPITFPTKGWNDFWKSNYATGRVLGPKGITFSGYNGKYDLPSSKYINSNIKNGNSWVTNLSDQPNKDWDSSYGSFSTGFNNLRLTIKDLAIINSTDPTTKAWSATDGLKPVSNGEWDTGHCYVKYPKKIQYKSPTGKNYGDTYYEDEAIYTKSKDKVNDIVIHNPVSTQKAVVIANDKRYDLRTTDSLAEGGDPPRTDNGCPGDATCDHQKLICTRTHTPHTDACYKNVSVTESFCTGVLNKHVHTEDCYKSDSKVYNYTGGRQTYTAPYTGWYDFEAAGAQGGSAFGGGTGGKGAQVNGQIYLTKGQTIYIYVGGKGGTGHQGGYNGGGAGNYFSESVTDSRYCGGAGGGMTSISTDSGSAAAPSNFRLFNDSQRYASWYYLGYKYTILWKHPDRGCTYNGATHDYGTNSTDTPSKCPVCGHNCEPYTVSIVENKPAWDPSKGYVIIAGAGGGAAGAGLNGGAGGTNGLAGTSVPGYSIYEEFSGRGGTQTEGGKSGDGGYGRNGLNGLGGSVIGLAVTETKGMGGGGAGWYGGGTGSYDYYKYTAYIGAGGGGSSKVDTGKTKSVTIKDGANAGDGYFKIIFQSPCTGALNAHEHTSACFKTTAMKVLVCNDPHHYVPGQPYDPKSLNMHYTYGDPRCWAPCMNNDNHKNFKEVTLGTGQVASLNDTFINLDREFKIYYPNVGDFAQQPTMHGILDTTDVRGMGYTDNMDVSKWTRNRTVTFPFHVIDANNHMWQATERIPLDELPHEDNVYTFYCVLSNQEVKNATVVFNSIATNAREIQYYSDNENVTNRWRNEVTKAARHTANKKQYIDVLGSIGSLTINDTEDFRFSNLFKITKDEWLIDNVLKKVYTNLPYKLVTGKTNVRNDVADASTNYQSAYGVTGSDTGGKNKASLLLPLTPALNNVDAFKDEPLRPGYNLLMDIETQGNYYGENREPITGKHQDSNLYYKMQVTPRYWALNIDTGVYTPVDVYEQDRGAYKIVNRFDNTNNLTEYYLYLDWINEDERRNYSSTEKAVTEMVKNNMTGVETEEPRIPSAGRDVLGTAGRLFLNDVNRTFVGSTKTYGVDKNPGGRIPEKEYMNQSQRWHFTIGLPSSSVFVPRNTPCTTENAKIVGNDKYVIICTADFKVKGDVWTLQYNGNGMNNPEPFKVFKDGKTYDPPTDPVTGKPVKDPIIHVYTPTSSAADDLATSGTH